MAKGRRRSAQEPAKERERHLIARPAVVLATLSTVVGIATGMFTLRDEIFPQEAGTANASLGAYQSGVGGICDRVNTAERARARDSRTLRRQLPKQRSTLLQRNLLLDGVNRSAVAGVDQSSRLSGLAVPEELAGRHATTLAAWTRNLDRVREYGRRLDGAQTRKQLEAAIAYLSRARPALSRDGTMLRAGLVRLGGSACRLDPPIVTRTVTLPPVYKPKPKPKPKQKPKPKPKPKLGSDVTPPTAPVPTAAPLPPTATPGGSSGAGGGSSVNPPSTDGGGGVSGGGEG